MTYDCRNCGKVFYSPDAIVSHVTSGGCGNQEEKIKQDLLSPGPCGKHPKVFWTCAGDDYIGVCTACESEKERMKPLVEALIETKAQMHYFLCHSINEHPERVDDGTCNRCEPARAALKALEK